MLIHEGHNRKVALRGNVQSVDRSKIGVFGSDLRVEASDYRRKFFSIEFRLILVGVGRIHRSRQWSSSLDVQLVDQSEIKVL